ncbi:hypothetical protein QUF80_22645 [Desulfococcaceae bacterium HSG8]|nr:hypothetical protein [Desulfococcaceae bacterium HSG8]
MSIPRERKRSIRDQRDSLPLGFGLTNPNHVAKGRGFVNPPRA